MVHNHRAPVKRCTAVYTVVYAFHAELALQLGSNFLFWLMYPTEGRSLIRAALALPSAVRLPRARLYAIYSEGTLARYQGDYAAARIAFEQCRDLDEMLGRTPRYWPIRWSLAWSDLADRNYTRALTEFEAVMAAEQGMNQDIPGGAGWIRIGVAIAACMLGDYVRARSLLEETLAIFRALGDTRHVITALTIERGINI
jgi:tetratricopeptide (TPR) repeat protein